MLRVLLCNYNVNSDFMLLAQAQDKLKAYNLDGRNFIGMAVHDLHVALNSQSNTTNASSPAEGQTVFKTFKHFVMNLPATAIEFLGNVLGIGRELLQL